MTFIAAQIFIRRDMQLADRFSIWAVFSRGEYVVRSASSCLRVFTHDLNLKALPRSFYVYSIA